MKQQDQQQELTQAMIDRILAGEQACAGFLALLPVLAIVSPI
jgi:hypothetical protein